MQHPAYRQIIDMGEKAFPWILRMADQDRRLKPLLRGFLREFLCLFFPRYAEGLFRRPSVPDATSRCFIRAGVDDRARSGERDGIRLEFVLFLLLDLFLVALPCGLVSLFREMFFLEIPAVAEAEQEAADRHAAQERFTTVLARDVPTAAQVSVEVGDEFVHLFVGEFGRERLMNPVFSETRIVGTNNSADGEIQ